MKTLNFLDREYKDNGYTHTRKNVRAIVYNSNHEIVLLKLYGDDLFGHRDYYETPGGGIKYKEGRHAALKREIEEEVGLKIKNIHFLARVIDFYNLINRRNDNYYYICEVDGFTSPHLEDYEKRIIQSSVWVDIDNAISLYENTVRTPIANLVIQRELPILKLAKEYLKNIK